MQRSQWKITGFGSNKGKAIEGIISTMDQQMQCIIDVACINANGKLSLQFLCIGANGMVLLLLQCMKESMKWQWSKWLPQRIQF